MTYRELLKAKVKKPKLSIETDVRIPYKSEPFQRGFYPNWTDVVYKISQGTPDIVKPYYKISDIEGNVLKQKFYPDQLQQISSDIYRIEKVLKRRIKNKQIQYFVKWLGYPSKFNSWVPSADITSLN